jgi:RNA polymerase sigma-70 factor, ECF subfamily
MIDKTIIEESIRGNLGSFKKLVDLSTPFAFSVAFRMLGNEAQSADVVQESMVTIWKSIARIKSPESYKSWLYRIVINKCYDQIRKNKRNPEFTADEKTWTLLSNRISENPSSEMENKEIAAIINTLTESLSPKQKAVFILSDLEEMSNEEICEITNMSKTNVKANLWYARKKIGELIENYM